MHNYGIQGNFLTWSASFLQGRTQQVLLDGTLSDPCLVLWGVTQSDVLGALFFLININDIHEGLSPSTKISLFADNILLYRTIADNSDNLSLQKDLDRLKTK